MRPRRTPGPRRARRWSTLATALAENLNAAAQRQAEKGTETFMATGRLKHGEKVPPAPRGRIPKTATPKEPIARRLRTKRGRAAHARRKTIVEPVFGQMATLQDGKRLLRGIDGARANGGCSPPATTSARSSPTPDRSPVWPPWSPDSPPGGIGRPDHGRRQAPATGRCGHSGRHADDISNDSAESSLTHPGRPAQHLPLPTHAPSWSLACPPWAAPRTRLGRRPGARALRKPSRGGPK
jgi:hypothetical protein